jgi:hypothetical protein
MTRFDLHYLDEAISLGLLYWWAAKRWRGRSSSGECVSSVVRSQERGEKSHMSHSHAGQTWPQYSTVKQPPDHMTLALTESSTGPWSKKYGAYSLSDDNLLIYPRTTFSCTAVEWSALKLPLFDCLSCEVHAYGPTLYAAR